MKKIFIILTALLTLTACTQKNLTNEKDVQDQKASSFQEEIEVNDTSKSTELSELSGGKTTFEDKNLNISFSYPKEWGEVEVEVESNSYGDEISYNLNFSLVGHFLSANDPETEANGRGGYWGDMSRELTSSTVLETWCENSYSAKNSDSCSVFTNPNGIKMIRHLAAVDWHGEGPSTTQYLFFNPNTHFVGVSLSSYTILLESDLSRETVEKEIKDLVESINFTSNAVPPLSLTPSKLHNKAIENQNPSLCEQIDPQSQHHDLCYEELAKKLSDHELCIKVKDQFNSEHCINDVALSSQNSSLCELIGDDFKRRNCILNIKKETKEPINIEDCPQSGSEQTTCFTLYAQQVEEPIDCEVIDSDEGQMHCWASLALKKNDSSLCANIAEQISTEEIYTNRNNCYRSIALANKNEEICNLYFPNNLPQSKEGCYADVAEVKLESSLCENVSDDFKKGGCYVRVAIAANKPELCDYAVDQQQKDYCYKNIEN